VTGNGLFSTANDAKYANGFRKRILSCVWCISRLLFLDPESVANVQAIGSLPSVRFEKRLGLVPEADLKKVKAALLKACAL